MIIEFEINGARVIVSGDNIAVSISDTREPQRREPGPPTPLKKWRAAAQLSAEEAARQVRVSLPTWSRWETGSRRVPAERVNDVVRVTGLAPETIRPDLAGVFAASS